MDAVTMNGIRRREYIRNFPLAIQNVTAIREVTEVTFVRGLSKRFHQTLPRLCIAMGILQDANET